MSISLSSSSIHSPFSNSSLPQLPVELLRRILEFSVPSHYNSSTYPRRQSTLRSLCLTSHLFRQIAQPILQQVQQVHLAKGKGVDVESICERSSWTLVLSITAGEGVTAKSIESLILKHHRLQALHVSHAVNSGNPFNLDFIPSLKYLTDLTLYGITLTFERSQPLSSLRRMSLTDCVARGGGLVLQSAMFPSLTILALLNHQLGTRTISFDALLPQLRLLISNTVAAESEVLRDYSDKILIDSADSWPIDRRRTLRNARHLRLRALVPSGGGARRLGAHLYEASQILRQTRQSTGIALETLLIDRNLLDETKNDGYTSYRYNRLIEMCEYDGTEVVFEEQGVSDNADSAITPELLRWMDRRKKEQRLSLD